MRFNLMEFSGSLGDLGTFIPIVVAVSIVNGMDIGIILIFAGLANIVTGILFGQPIPVQPMKAIAAIAIAEQLLPEEIAVAGFLAGIIILLLAVTGLVDKMEKLLPKALIRGIQLGVGLNLAIKGIEFIGSTSLTGLNSLMTAIILGIATLFLSRNKIFPAALFLFLSGSIILFILTPALLNEIHFTLPSFSIVSPSADSWLKGFTHGTIPQVPLTLLNSVFAVCILSGDLFPGKKISSKKMAASVGLMNILGCGFGALPVCHGSGGLAGQYHFGARTGGSVVMLGSVKLLAGIFLGVTIMNLLQQYPQSILGIMLIFSGYELSRPVRDQNTLAGISVTVATALGIVALNTLYGFLIGIVIFFVFKILNLNSQSR